MEKNIILNNLNTPADLKRLKDYLRELYRITAQPINGNWIPDLQFGGAKVGITYATREGTYVKIGRIVIPTFNITLTSKGSSTGVATVRGLPFTVMAGQGGVCPVMYYSAMSAALVHCHRFEATTDYISLAWQVNNAFSQVIVTQMTDTDFANGSRLMAGGVYFTDE